MISHHKVLFVIQEEILSNNILIRMELLWNYLPEVRDHPFRLAITSLGHANIDDDYLESKGSHDRRYDV